MKIKTLDIEIRDETGRVVCGTSVTEHGLRCGEAVVNLVRPPEPTTYQATGHDGLDFRLQAHTVIARWR